MLPPPSLGQAACVDPAAEVARLKAGLLQLRGRIRATSEPPCREDDAQCNSAEPAAYVLDQERTSRIEAEWRVKVLTAEAEQLRKELQELQVQLSAVRSAERLAVVARGAEEAFNCQSLQPLQDAVTALADEQRAREEESRGLEALRSSILALTAARDEALKFSEEQTEVLQHALAEERHWRDKISALHSKGWPCSNTRCQERLRLLRAESEELGNSMSSAEEQCRDLQKQLADEKAASSREQLLCGELQGRVRELEELRLTEQQLLEKRQEENLQLQLQCERLQTLTQQLEGQVQLVREDKEKQQLQLEQVVSRSRLDLEQLQQRLTEQVQTEQWEKEELRHQLHEAQHRQKLQVVQEQHRQELDTAQQQLDEKANDISQLREELHQLRAELQEMMKSSEQRTIGTECGAAPLSQLAAEAESWQSADPKASRTGAPGAQLPLTARKSSGLQRLLEDWQAEEEEEELGHLQQKCQVLQGNTVPQLERLLLEEQHLRQSAEKELIRLRAEHQQLREALAIDLANDLEVAEGRDAPVLHCHRCGVLDLSRVEDFRARTEAEAQLRRLQEEYRILQGMNLDRRYQSQSQAMEYLGQLQKLQDRFNEEVKTREGLQQRLDELELHKAALETMAESTQQSLTEELEALQRSHLAVEERLRLERSRKEEAQKELQELNLRYEALEANGIPAHRKMIEELREERDDLATLHGMELNARARAETQVSDLHEKAKAELMKHEARVRELKSTAEQLRHEWDAAARGKDEELRRRQAAGVQMSKMREELSRLRIAAAQGAGQESSLAYGSSGSSPSGARSRARASGFHFLAPPPAAPEAASHLEVEELKAKIKEHEAVAQVLLQKEDEVEQLQAKIKALEEADAAKQREVLQLKAEAAEREAYLVASPKSSEPDLSPTNTADLQDVARGVKDALAASQAELEAGNERYQALKSKLTEEKKRLEEDHLAAKADVERLMQSNSALLEEKREMAKELERLKGELAAERSATSSRATDGLASPPTAVSLQEPFDFSETF